MFRRIGHKLVATIGIAVSIGLVVVVTFDAARQEQTMLAQNERSMKKVTDSVIRSLRAIMVGGHADIAGYYAERLKDIPDIADFRILRPDGREAFLDGDTIGEVNRRLGGEAFAPRSGGAPDLGPMADARLLTKAAARARPLASYEEIAGDPRMVVLAPIVNDEDECVACHGEHPLRGFVKLSTSLAPVHADVRETWVQAGQILLVWLTLIIALAAYLIHRSVVRPIVTVSGAMEEVASGRLSRAVPVFGDDELGAMARSFNRMTGRLLRTYSGYQTEQNKLTTIILAAIEGIVVTDQDLNVILVNPAAEALFGKSAAEIITGGFLSLFDDPERMRAWLADGNDGEDVAYRGRTLNVQVATIADEDGGVVGTSALIRNVTDERDLEERLRQSSTTDALTGLGNRRALDQALEVEVMRARRYRLDLALVIIDIDHFKSFNDSYGHDQGDRVLKAVARSIQATLRNVDVPCRFGGEEFVILLPGLDLGAAFQTAERLRANVEGIHFHGKKVTISAGVAALRESRIATPQGLLKAADEALYEAKRTGRNRVALAAPAEAVEAEAAGDG